jgi:serine protease AprX
MKNILFKIGLIIFSVAFSQTNIEKQAIIKETNTVGLLALKTKFSQENLEREARISKFLLDNPSLKRRTDIDSKVNEIYDIVNSEIIYLETDNAGAAITSRANRLYNNGGLGLNIQGQNMMAFVWDGGSARTTHTEFNNKVISADSGTLSSHATHVTGTVVAQGFSASVRGIAFNASATSYDWNDDFTEMTNEAANGMLVSNHSYGPTSTTDWIHGAYNSTSRNFDLIAFNAPFYLATTSAGNDRNDFNDAILGPYLAQKGGYNLTKGMKNSKNILTVGAVNQVSNYNNASSVVMTSFSNWGPTDDGRIKPDIVTKGTSVVSTTSTNDTSTGSSNGTSMAAPGVAATALLVQQYYKSINPDFMRAATLKGLLLHTADEAGWEQGPDYEYGWGLINAEKAANVITKKTINASLIEENTLNTGQTFSKTVYSPGIEPLIVSISWTDPAGTANSGTTDPTNLNIVNDLDVRVTRNNTTFFPWTLDPANPSNQAVRTTDNFRDNFEKIEIDAPTAGAYSIQVTHKNANLVNSLQRYSIIVSGINQNLSEKDFNSSDLSIIIFPNPVKDFLQFSMLEDDKVTKVSIVDISGKEVFISNVINNNSLDVSSLQNGIYFVKFYSMEKSTVKKFVKE